MKGIHNNFLKNVNDGERTNIHSAECFNGGIYKTLWNHGKGIWQF